MPGLFPGRVIEVRHPGAVSDHNVICSGAVNRMVDLGMAELTGTDPGDIRSAWGTFFEMDDVVGIKVNPVGRSGLPKDRGRRPRDAVGCVSSPEVLLKIVRCLKQVRIKPQDIIIFERYAEEFVDAGYANLMSEPDMDGVRWCASAAAYSDDQVDIAGFDSSHPRFVVAGAGPPCGRLRSRHL